MVVIVKKDRAELIANLEVALTDLDTVKALHRCPKTERFQNKGQSIDRR
jgi:hypothetical protein